MAEPSTRDSRISRSPKRRPIKFEGGWLSFEECKDIVRNHWSNLPRSEAHNFGPKMMSCLSKLSHWNKAWLQGSLSSTIKRKEEEIKSISSSNEALKDLNLRLAEKELDSLLEEEEAYWKFQAREDWLNWRGRNMRWFHSRASQRKKRNLIKGFYNSNGVWVKEEEDMGREASRYFLNLFSSSEPNLDAIECTTMGMSMKISEKQRKDLEKTYSRVDIEFSLKNMSPNEAPREDGAHATFFQSYWDSIGDDVTGVCLGVLNNGEDVGPLNKTLLALILKTPNPERLEEYRPISLCNVIYKT